jgi:hypothetical protein
MGTEKSVTRNTSPNRTAESRNSTGFSHWRPAGIIRQPGVKRIFPSMVLLPFAVLVFAFVNQRAASKDGRSAAWALVVQGWSARRIRIDRKASAPSGAPLCRPDSVLSTPKNKKPDFSFPMPGNNRFSRTKGYRL